MRFGDKYLKMFPDQSTGDGIDATQFKDDKGIQHRKNKHVKVIPSNNANNEIKTNHHGYEIKNPLVYVQFHKILSCPEIPEDIRTHLLEARTQLQSYMEVLHYLHDIQHDLAADHI